mmetsp:Transcript_115082/g.256971  ORF Transcript_115082/g.256971 Transcript_115082/m.256971 type:complete len:244 (+) Transcript_115082:88-819(+)
MSRRPRDGCLIDPCALASPSVATVGIGGHPLPSLGTRGPTEVHLVESLALLKCVEWHRSPRVEQATLRRLLRASCCTTTCAWDKTPGAGVGHGAVPDGCGCGRRFGRLGRAELTGSGDIAAVVHVLQRHEVRACGIGEVAVQRPRTRQSVGPRASQKSIQLRQLAPADSHELVFCQGAAPEANAGELGVDGLTQHATTKEELPVHAYVLPLRCIDDFALAREAIDVELRSARRVDLGHHEVLS